MENSIQDWFTFDYSQSSPDIFNTCYPVSVMNPPNTNLGFSYPHNGNAMAGLSFYISPNRKEVITVELTEALVADSAYCVSFWIKNAAYQSYYWSNNIGALFTDDTIVPWQILENPHVKSPEEPDKNEWVEVSGYYVANGTEKHLNIGYFGNPVFYHPLPYPDDYIYYFLDDISVIQCDKDSLLSVVFELPNVITCDNNNINDAYQIRKNNITKLNIQIFNRWGNPVREYDGLTETWNGTNNQGDPLTEGIYFVKAIAETTFGETIQKTQFVQLTRP